MTHLTLVENDNNALTESDAEKSWAEIKDGKLVKFDLAICSQLAAAFDSGNREPGNEVAKLCMLIIDDVCFGSSDGIITDEMLASGRAPIYRE
jgi:hypothetical protein